MLEDFTQRVLDFAHFIVDNNSTIRTCAHHFGIAKSTVHFDLKYRLNTINPTLYQEVKKVLINNFNEKHIRGGESTRQKYLHKNECGTTI